ncbi:rhodanese-like domain-containing protein [Leptothrix discophora]|uniref:Rhodanese-like domain-containing protein n=1 Tax=Leptothrix discophora TaxID=89 RepID=A0ABT9G4B5_LEPDI|nr:rhodanese-like domain-containing protein [Leptothrix discophora]MDP4301330.1 rhodanese-like domain-containing protein [Leptothrix discophora]
MSFLIDNWYWLAAAVVSGIALLVPGLGSSRAGIAVQDAVRLINREKAVVIDVCSSDEYAGGHVAGSRNIPLDQLEGAKNLPSNKDQPLVIVCATGSRASRAAARLVKLGHQNVHVLSGGMGAWRDANLPVEKTA